MPLPAIKVIPNFWQLLFAVLICSDLLLEISALDPKRIISLKYDQKEFPLVQRSHIHRRRILRGTSRQHLYGHVITKGYYYTDLVLGTPGKRFSVIVDTGSSMTYVPCSTCSRCGRHEDKPYSPTTSKTYQRVTCDSSMCLSSECGGENQCSYSRYYAERSSSVGIIVSDVVSLGTDNLTDSTNVTRISFGCEMSETGEIYSQTADGIMGLGRGKTSIIKQLVDASAIDDSFSLCFGGMSHGDGAMIMGSHPMPSGTVYAPYDPRKSIGFYNLHIKEIRVSGKALAFSSSIFEAGYGSVLDSGTTFTYLPETIFPAFVSAVQNGIKIKAKRAPAPDPNFPSDICYAAANETLGNLIHLGDFPDVDFVFSPDAVYHLSPENYLFRHFGRTGAYCLGFFPSQEPGTLLGGIMVRNTLVTYDRKNKRIGFFKTDCKKLPEVLP